MCEAIEIFGALLLDSLLPNRTIGSTGELVGSRWRECLRLKAMLRESLGDDAQAPLDRAFSNFCAALALRSMSRSQTFHRLSMFALVAYTYSLPFILASRIGWWTPPASAALGAIFWGAEVATLLGQPFEVGLPGTRLATGGGCRAFIAEMLAHIDKVLVCLCILIGAGRVSAIVRAAGQEPLLLLRCLFMHKEEYIVQLWEVEMATGSFLVSCCPLVCSKVLVWQLRK